MKKLILAALVAASSMFMTGCDPDPVAVKALATTMGASAGLVVKIMNLDSESVNYVVGILSTVDKAVPEEDQTFYEVWSPYFEAAVDKLGNKLSDWQKKLVRQGLDAAVKGLDRLFEKKPEWKKQQQTVTGVINGFISSFTGVLSPNNSLSFQRSVDADYDEVKIIAERCGVEIPRGFAMPRK